MVGKNGWCFTCGNNGFLDKECPSCGRKPLSSSMNFEYAENTNEFVSEIDAFGVPDAYRGVIWDSAILRNTKQGKQNDLAFDKFVKSLEKVNNFFVRGVLSPKSAIIIAPAGYSKMVFAYSCIQRALDHGFSVAPLLDTIELKRLLVLASENPNYKLYGSISYDDYVMSDVMFITVTKLKQREWAYETIQEILDRRDRKGLSTFVISRFNLDEISKRDYTNQFDAIASSVSSNDYKYPAIIRYQDRVGG